MGSYKAKLICMMCGYEQVTTYDPKADVELSCPRCGSNSIRVKRVE